MAKFELFEDMRVCTWRRYFYEVEAETLEEAVELVKDSEVDCTNMEEFYEDGNCLTPDENGDTLLGKFTLLKMISCYTQM